MMQDVEQAIRERAYQLWMESGCEDGSADAHWLAAQREILSASLPRRSVAMQIDRTLIPKTRHDRARGISHRDKHSAW
jgi:hypothetical protein